MDTSKYKNDTVLTLNEASEYTGLSKATMYGYTHRNQIPYSKPGGNRIFFLKSDIDSWLMSNKIKCEKSDNNPAVTNLNN